MVRLASGAVFLVFGIGKFSQHGSEVDSFEQYGLPSPDAFAYAIGVVEIAGAVLLAAGLATRLAAVVLAGAIGRDGLPALGRPREPRPRSPHRPQPAGS